MADRFKFTGILSIPKETENFKPFQKHLYDTGCKNKTFKPRITTDDGTQLLNLSAITNVNDPLPIIVYKGKNEKGVSERLTIPFEQRNDPVWLEQAPYRSKYIVDLYPSHNVRISMKRALDKIAKNPELAASELAEFGVSTKEELQKKYDESLAKRKEFLSMWDFIDYLKTLIENGTLDNVKVEVSGDIQIDHGTKRDFINYVPRTVRLAKDSAKSEAVVEATLYYTKDSISQDLDEGTISVDGYIRYYDRKLTKRLKTTSYSYSPYSITFNLGANKEKRAAHIMRAILKYEDMMDDDVYFVGLAIKAINGAQKVSITYDDLPEEVQEAIDFGDVTLEDVLREFGREKRGNTIRANVYKSLQTEFVKGARPTACSPDDFIYNEEPVIKEDDDLDFDFD